MKRLLSSLVVGLVLVAGAAIGSEKHIKANLEEINGSGVTGFVNITQLPKEGSNVHAVIHGLQPGETYTSFYYESADCSAPAEALETFTADDEGNATASGKIDEDLDEVGSISVRAGSGYGTLLACADIHGG